MMMFLDNFGEGLNVAVIGASGGIGRAFVMHLATSSQVEQVYSFSRTRSEIESDKLTYHILDFTDERSIQMAVQSVPNGVMFDVIIVATGLLHDGDIMPEKGLKDLDLQKFHDIFAINSFGPAMIMKHFLPRIHKDKRSVFAALSARVGSISDNQLGGWYAYRASKSALNMLIKNAAIEMGRRYKKVSIISLHPGTVDTNLSKPFQGHVPDQKLFTPEYAAEKMLEVMNAVTPEQSGKIFDYLGKEIEP